MKLYQLKGAIIMSSFLSLNRPHNVVLYVRTSPDERSIATAAFQEELLRQFCAFEDIYGRKERKCGFERVVFIAVFADVAVIEQAGGAGHHSRKPPDQHAQTERIRVYLDIDTDKRHYRGIPQPPNDKRK